MKKILWAFIGGLIALLVGLGITLMPATLPVPSGLPAAEKALATPPEGMRVSTFLAGYMESDELFTFRGGKIGEKYISGMSATLVQHPKGDLLIDSGFGSDVDQQFLLAPALMQKLSSVSAETPVADQLRAGGYNMKNLKGVFITHSHWDHVSGLPDMVGVPVYLPVPGKAFIENGGDVTLLARSFADVNYLTYDFTEKPYETFARSYDLHGDGSVVVVPMPGHTPGSVGIFVNLPSGKRYLFVGDLVWATEGVDIPAERPWLARRMVDHDPQAVRDMVVKVHQLKKLRPELIIVPAHDRRVHEKMTLFPATEN